MPCVQHVTQISMCPPDAVQERAECDKTAIRHLSTSNTKAVTEHTSLFIMESPPSSDEIPEPQSQLRSDCELEEASGHPPPIK